MHGEDILTQAILGAHALTTISPPCANFATRSAAGRPVRVIKLPNGQDCRLGVYVGAWQALKTVPPHADCKGFGYFPESASDILRAMETGMHARINRPIPWFGLGRKWASIYQVGLMRDARRLKEINQRIRTYQFETPDITARFGHLLTRNDDW
jgi:hypothetical protein